MANINLLPVEYKEKEKFRFSRFLLILFFALLLLGSTFLYYYLEFQIDTRQQQLKVMKTELAAIEKIIQEVKDLERDKKIIEERIAVIQGLIDNQSRLSRILGEFSASILDEVWVDSITLSANQTFDLTANTYNNYLIAKYMVVLKNEPTFDNIELAYVRKSTIRERDVESEMVNFKLSGIFISPKVIR